MADNDRIIDMAKALGRAIQMDERYKSFDAARTENDSDAKLQELIGSFNLIKMNLNNALSDEAQDGDKIQKLNDEMQKVYAEIMGTSGMQKYQTASHEIEQLINYINAIITTALEGGNPDEVNQPDGSCGGECGSCGGCH
ncbi:MAG: YlbF family regulator [Ruminococcaceae bacterium]|nr:YlbF family regulator [Oscillospiraceae bacterium]